MSRARISFVAPLLVLAACGGSTKEAAAPAPAVTAQSGPEVRAEGSQVYDLCVSMFRRDRECTSAYIPALVDLRISLDRPPGIAQSARDEGRDALISQALQEWSADSTDASIDTVCRNVVDGYDPAHDDGLRAGVEACLAAADCNAYVACIIPVTQHMWEARDAKQAKQAK